MLGVCLVEKKNSLLGGIGPRGAPNSFCPSMVSTVLADSMLLSAGPSLYRPLLYKDSLKKRTYLGFFTPVHTIAPAPDAGLKGSLRLWFKVRTKERLIGTVKFHRFLRHIFP